MTQRVRHPQSQQHAASHPQATYGPSTDQSRRYIQRDRQIQGAAFEQVATNSTADGGISALAARSSRIASSLSTRPTIPCLPRREACHTALAAQGFARPKRRALANARPGAVCAARRSRGRRQTRR